MRDSQKRQLSEIYRNCRLLLRFEQNVGSHAEFCGQRNVGPFGVVAQSELPSALEIK
jgi:hypothetical protein